MSTESFDRTHERLRELLTESSPADAAGQLLAQGHAPLHVLHALVTETKPAVVGALDGLVREKAQGPLPEAYEAYVALQTAKASAPGHTIDRDLYAVGAAERAGHGREAMGQALPYVVDLPDPSVDRQAVARLLLLPEVPTSGYERQPLPSYTVVTPLANLWVEERERPAQSPVLVVPDTIEPKAGHLRAQLAALDADRHQVVVRSVDGGIRYLAPSRDGAAFVAVDQPTYLTDSQVVAAAPTIQQLNATANIDLVSESAKHHYLVLDGLDAGQSRDLDHRFGANLLMRVGDEHLAVLRLPEDPSRAQTLANLLKAKYSTRSDSPIPVGPPFATRDGGVELVKARVEDLLPASQRERDRSTSSPSSSAEAIERFAEHRSMAFQTAMETGFRLEPAQLDRIAARSLLAEGYRSEQVVSAVQFASPGLGDRASSLEGYARRIVEAVMNQEGTAERSSPPDVGGR